MIQFHYEVSQIDKMIKLLILSLLFYKVYSSNITKLNDCHNEQDHISIQIEFETYTLWSKFRINLDLYLSLSIIRRDFNRYLNDEYEKYEFISTENDDYK